MTTSAPPGFRKNPKPPAAGTKPKVPKPPASGDKPKQPKPPVRFGKGGKVRLKAK